jgi:two-component system cell cycle response regulator
MRVLFVGDAAEAPHGLAGLLRRWGYDPVTVEDGWAALAVLRGPETPSLVVLDCGMSGLNGLEICREIRRHTDRQLTYVILVIGRGDQKQMRFGLESGADDYLVKPVNADKLQISLSTGERMLALQEQLLATEPLYQTQVPRDALTGLWNRATILEILDRELARSRREGHLVSVIMADLDHFKSTNETFSQHAGDEVLRQTAQRLLSALRPYNAVGRYGDEFLMVLPDCGAGKALMLAERLRKSVATEPVMVDGEPIPITLSLGVAGWDAKQSASELLRTADGALYQAKSAGRNHAVYSEGLPATCWLPG